MARAVHPFPLREMRFSLRTLALGIAVIAVLLAGVIGYRQATMCELVWLQPGSPAAATLFPKSNVVTRLDGSYSFTYYARCRKIGFLISPRLPISDYTLHVDREAIKLESNEQQQALAALAAIQARDVPKPGVFVIRGRVQDQNGKPLAHAMVDLMGQYVFVNHFPTRDDGTFTMVLDDPHGGPPAGSGYYICVRAAEETVDEDVRWNTGGFSLDPNMPEREALIIVPR